MRRRSLSPWLPLLTLVACVPGGPLWCGTRGATPVGQFGPYVEPYLLAQLPDGDTLTVYRVKMWQFSSGEPPALQLEFQSRVAMTDTVAMRAQLDRVWPAFEPALRSGGFRGAIVTATDLRRKGSVVAGTWNIHSFGYTAARAPDGTWHLPDGTRLPVPRPTDTAARIVQRDGRPLPQLRSP